MGGDENGASVEGAKKIYIFRNDTNSLFEAIMLTLPESFVGAGDRGGAESFTQSGDSVPSKSDFLFREPTTGFA